MRLRWFKNLNPSIQVVVLLGLLFVLLAFYVPLSKYIKPATISSLSLPLEVCQGLSSNAKEFWKFQDLVEENKSLKKRINKLSGQLSQLQEAAQENERLRGLLSLPQRKTVKMQAALLIGRDSSNWTRIVTINRGRLNGVDKGMPVVLGEKLVGKVIEAAPNVSKVTLIVDINSKVPAKILRTREEGVVFGTFAKEEDICKMKYIQDVKIGDKIISSGLGGIYPRGLLIGEVVAVEEEKNSLYKVAEVQPAIRFSSLEEVMVVTGP